MPRSPSLIPAPLCPRGGLNQEGELVTSLCFPAKGLWGVSLYHVCTRERERGGEREKEEERGSK